MPPPAVDGERDRIRSLGRARRLAVDADAADRAAGRLARLLLEMPQTAGPGRLATYLPVDGEIDPNRAADRLRERGWQLHLPVTPPGPARLRFAPWTAATPLRRSGLGTLEPAELAPTVEGDQLDVVLVPCAAVDPRGNRLGFGAGYYDRTFARPATAWTSGGAPSTGGRSTGPPGEGARVPSWNGRRPLLIAVAHEDQVVDEIVALPHDVPVDVVVTDAGVRWTPAGRAR